MRPWRVAATALSIVSAAVVLATANQLAQPPQTLQRVEAVVPATPRFQRHESWPHYPTTTAAPATEVTEAPSLTASEVTKPTVPAVERPQSQTTRGDTPGERIKQCESGGDYTLRDPNGHYGAWQFSPSTWNSVASETGRSDLVGVNPADASPADQDAMAAHLWNGGSGSGQWSCKQ